MSKKAEKARAARAARVMAAPKPARVVSPTTAPSPPSPAQRFNIALTRLNTFARNAPLGAAWHETWREVFSEVVETFNALIEQPKNSLDAPKSADQPDPPS